MPEFLPIHGTRIPLSFAVTHCHLCTFPTLASPPKSSIDLIARPSFCKNCNHSFKPYSCRICVTIHYWPLFWCWSCDRAEQTVKSLRPERKCRYCGYKVDGTSMVKWMCEKFDPETGRPEEAEEVDMDEMMGAWTRAAREVEGRRSGVRKFLVI